MAGEMEPTELAQKMPGAWRGYYLCKGQYPTSERELVEHLDSCQYCLEKHNEFERGRWKESESGMFSETT